MDPIPETNAGQTVDPSLDPTEWRRPFDGGGRFVGPTDRVEVAMPAHPTDPDADGGPSGLDPTNPTDTSPLLIEQRWAGEGRTGDFTVLAGARLRCETCGTVSSASDQRADDAIRTEGVSDPADTTIVIPLCCPHCSASGVITLSYGPEADPDTSDFVAAVPRDPRRSTLPTGPGAVP